MPTLFVVGTPIGNMEDITLRALRVLKEVNVIFAEDTRMAKKLLARYEIKTPVSPVHTRDEVRAAEAIMVQLREGKNVALVSDAGTPGISDPGALLVQKVREVLPEAKVESVPGPSALTAALSVAGVSASEFVFLGFLPHKKGRETLFKEIAASARPVIFYESPHRIVKALASLHKHAPAKQVTLCRELTKIYEGVKTGTPDEIAGYLKNNPEKIRGECVIIVSV